MEILKEALQQAIILVLTGAITIVAKEMIIRMKKDTEWLKQKISNEKIQNAIDQLECAAEKAVLTVSQTYTDDLKKNGSFKAEEQRKALEMACTIAKRQMTEDAAQALKENSADIEQMIKDAIEAEIAKRK